MDQTRSVNEIVRNNDIEGDTGKGAQSYYNQSVMGKTTTGQWLSATEAYLVQVQQHTSHIAVSAKNYLKREEKREQTSTADDILQKHERREMSRKEVLASYLVSLSRPELPEQEGPSSPSSTPH